MSTAVILDFFRGDGADRYLCAFPHPDAAELTAATKLADGQWPHPGAAAACVVQRKVVPLGSGDLGRQGPPQ